MFLLPALLSQGILKVKEVYSFPRNYYYDLVSIILTLAFMALLRIKNPEQLKQCKPGELGRIIGLDRLPEVRCLRKDIKELSIKEKALEFNNILINHWYENVIQTKVTTLFYILTVMFVSIMAQKQIYP